MDNVISQLSSAFPNKNGGGQPPMARPTVDDSKDKASDCKKSTKLQVLENAIKDEALDRIIALNEEELKNNEATLNEHLEEICKANDQFCNEMSEFNDKYGILSPWWGTMMAAIRDPGIIHDAALRRERRLANIKMHEEISTLQAECDAIRADIDSRQKRKLEDDATIIRLRDFEESLRNAPFGPEFLMLKTAVQISNSKKKQIISVNEEVVQQNSDFLKARELFSDMELPRRRTAEFGTRCNPGGETGQRKIPPENYGEDDNNDGDFGLVRIRKRMKYTFTRQQGVDEESQGNKRTDFGNEQSQSTSYKAAIGPPYEVEWPPEYDPEYDVSHS